MNILYYLGPFPKLSESFILNEIYELEQRGHNVAVCALDRPAEGITHEEYDELDVPTHWIESPSYRDVSELLSTKTLHPRILNDAFYPASLQRHAANLFRAKRCIEFVERLDWPLDHVHTHFAKPSSFSARYVASYYNSTFTVTTHAFDIYDEPVGRYTPFLFRNCDRIVTISAYNRAHIRKQFVDDTPIDIVRAGIRPEKFRPTATPNRNRVLTVSRFVEKKGLEYGLRAVAKATQQLPDIEYHLIGSGPKRSDLEALVDELNLGDTVRFLDNVDDERLLTEYDEARCFLLPCVVAESGDRDGIPVVLMEAMAMETPPVSTTVSGIPELVEHGGNGLLVEPRRSEAIADALETMLRDDSEWDEFRNRARETIVSDFNIVTEVEKLERTFRKCQAR
ncbi:glycosyltransferase [Haloplanus litoreus]|uniref:Glycosyltransferase n=1 Tax=Haloplanus litoreus TaxID=767515 RepID=A0ABD6A2D1_9EURY